MRINLLTCSEMPDLYKDDLYFKYYLEDLGADVKVVNWRDKIPDSDLEVIRSCWDYIKNANDFLKRVHNKKIINNCQTVLWNIDKIYLERMSRFVKIVPSTFNGMPLPDWEVCVAKPRISNGGNGVKIHKKENIKPRINTIWQKYMPEVTKNGEISVIYIGNELTHCVEKKSKKDFRVQHFYGGEYKLYNPDQSLKEISEKVIKNLPVKHHYARLDFLTDSGFYYLSEIELIEPLLHFELNPEAALKLARKCIF